MPDLFSNADGYESVMGRWSAHLAALFLDFAGLSDGERVLDVGCGTGSLVAQVAQRASHSTIVGIDPSQPFVVYARERFPDSRIKIDHGTAVDLPYEAASFDRALSLLVFMFIDEDQRAAGEMRRVTRPGGTVAACTWRRDGLEMSTILWEVITGFDPKAVRHPERVLRLNQPGELLELWNQVGFEDCQETELELAMQFSSFDDYWEPYMQGAGPDAAYLLSISAEERQEIRDAVRLRMLQRSRDGAFTLTARALAVRGRVPKMD